ncbi:Rieske (2Fe-2S) protein [Bradyrhizobium manausense]|uniref:Rieske (2Fe-2S) protein n=1 Tax=Bradyrhizobium manausense TaxID=989370 RepID=UPI001BA4B7DA|nr:Rieske (2Fe-2S) protein [Bradyrhizobium manausense]MBR0828635.1 Rieske (2Fe-2S) protein [Bradyrhizobium manausense]
MAQIGVKQQQQFAVGAVDGFPVGQMVMVEVGEQAIGVVKLSNGELRALRNWCPHKGAPICRGIIGGTWPPSDPGKLDYDGTQEVLVCPWHGFEYDLKTGREMFGTGRTRLRLYPVSVQDGTVYVSV